jgi:predicted DNA-binding protein YlxM (UPF0122 family)
MSKKWLIPLGLALILALAVGGVALAQDVGPKTLRALLPEKLEQLASQIEMFRGFGGGWQVFDAIAQTLKLTPTQLFEQLHSGKTLKEIAEAQGVDIQTVWDTIKQFRQDQARAGIEKALQAGKMSKDQADWMLKGMENGWRWPVLPGRSSRLPRIGR